MEGHVSVTDSESDTQITLGRSHDNRKDRVRVKTLTKSCYKTACYISAIQYVANTHLTFLYSSQK